jgi:outer membrane protein assembly factor BamB
MPRFRRRALAIFLAVGPLWACGDGEQGTTDPITPSDADGGGATGGDNDGGGGGPPPPPPDPAVLTYHNDNARTGANLAETILTPDAVQTRGMNLAFSRPVEGNVVAQALYVPKLDFDGTPHDVFYVFTMKNYVYAFDANERGESGTLKAGVVWMTMLQDPESAARGIPRGIFSTPVIDREAGEIYLVYSTKDVWTEPFGESTVNAEYFLAALDLKTGDVRRQVKIEASVPRGNGKTLSFLARNHRQRPALLLANGSIYVAFGTRSKEHMIEYHGWMMRYDARSFDLQNVWCATPDRAQLGQGGGIWGAAPAADSAGNIFLATGNALADHAAGSYGNSIVGLTPDLNVLGAFTPIDPDRRLEIFDVDLGSGGVVVIPRANQIVGGGKTGILYLLDKERVEKLQEFQAFINVYDPGFVVDSSWAGGPHLHGSPVVWQGPDKSFATVYHWSENDALKAFKYRWDTDRLEPESAIVGEVLTPEGTEDKPIMPGGMISLTANGKENGIIWASVPASHEHDPESGELKGLLLAFDAVTLQKLWETNIPSIPKWMPPTVSDGKVFMPTSSETVLVYELGPAW